MLLRRNTKQQDLSLHTLLASGKTRVVGTLHDASGIRSLSKINKIKMSGIDLLEARLDSLPAKFLDSLPLSSLKAFPMIATARHPAEGGAGDLSPAERRDLLESALNWASAIDVELRSARALAPLIATAHQHGRTVILSHHNFSLTPKLAVMKELARRASDLGADLLKIATFLDGPADLGRLIEFQSAKLQVPVTCMGMGPAGRFSRIVLSGFGAPLCYGWLGKQQVPGQWPALKLAGVLSEVLPV